MAPPGHKNHLHSFLMGSPHRGPITIGDAELRIEQSAVDIDGQQADGSSHQEILAVRRERPADLVPRHEPDELATRK